MKRFKLLVYVLAVAIVSIVVLSSCSPNPREVSRIERACIIKMEAKQDSIDAMPIKVYCAMIEGYNADSCLFARTIYDRDSMNLEIEIGKEESNLSRYAVDVDSIATNKWSITVD